MTERAHSHPEQPDLPELVARFRRQSRKLTGPRQAVLEILRRQAHPAASKEIFAALPRGLCDLATVYRALHVLERVGMVKRYDLGDGIARFELLPEGDDGHHHHLVCTRCAGVVEIEGCSVDEVEQRLAAQNGFKAVTHRLEFFGICPACQ
ncbi:MAG TPA: Fur family transcriptional regulator [Verrucomicrobiae bacterium]